MDVIIFVILCGLLLSSCMSQEPSIHMREIKTADDSKSAGSKKIAEDVLAGVRHNSNCYGIGRDEPHLSRSVSFSSGDIRRGFVFLFG